MPASLATRVRHNLSAIGHAGDLRDADFEVVREAYAAVAESRAWTDDGVADLYDAWVDPDDLPTHAKVRAALAAMDRAGDLRRLGAEDVHNVLAIYLHHVAPASRVRRNPTPAAPTLSGFDLFDADDATPAATALATARSMVGAEPSMYDASSILTDAPLLAAIDQRFYYWQRQGVWMLDIAAPPAEAERIALRVQKKLIARSKLPASVPLMHDKRLLVGASDGTVRELPPIWRR